MNLLEKVKGFVITHGHEDHIGALPYILKEMNIPIYATRLTMGIIENKLASNIFPPFSYRCRRIGMNLLRDHSRQRNRQ